MKDDRLHKSAPGRGSRAAEDAARANSGMISDDERQLAEMLQNFEQESLPTLPEIPGYHTCWLSTTNQTDPIYKRERIGYVPVKPEDVPGFEQFRVKSGALEGLIAVNEMVANKLPEEIYQAAMRRFHHQKPQEEQEMLSLRSEQEMESLRDSHGTPLVRREGASGRQERTPAPVFD